MLRSCIRKHHRQIWSGQRESRRPASQLNDGRRPPFKGSSRELSLRPLNEHFSIDEHWLGAYCVQRVGLTVLESNHCLQLAKIPSPFTAICPMDSLPIWSATKTIFRSAKYQLVTLEKLAQQSTRPELNNTIGIRSRYWQPSDQTLIGRLISRKSRRTWPRLVRSTCA